ncbi:MAG TPA: hypothetical protein P5121_17145 [Caldilineaceae bacterium]|nr:hypothetical protein [Caldilineaceae bacterium]
MAMTIEKNTKTGMFTVLTSPLCDKTRLWLLIAALLLFPAVAPTAVWAQNQSGITAPASGNSVSGDVVVSGTAVIDPFLRYELYYKLEPSGDDAYIYFDGGTNPIINGQLGIWRTSDLPPGTYSIRLRVVKTDGNYGEFVASNLNLNVEPTPTATSSEPTETPIPTATYTPAPQPTPIVGQVTQPDLPGQPTPTAALVLAPTPVPQNNGSGGSTTGEESTITFEEDPASEVTSESSSFTRQLGEMVALDRLRGYFVTGMQYSAMLILGAAVLLAGKRIFSWVWTQYR